VLTPGQKIFEYEVTRSLGQGGFGAVVEAHDPVLDRRVAIKELLLEKSASDNTVKRFVQEARVAASLEHPNIVSIYGMRLEGKQFYMIMEFLPGGSLLDMLKKQGKLPADQAVQLAIGICDGLANFHRRGIIHRDIKAENILLTADGRPKVADFGIAHVPKAAGGLALTQAGFQPSSLLYSSPEQVRGESLDTRSDVYQIGELLFYMLAGYHYINLTALELEAVTQSSKNQMRAQMKLYELLEKAICEEMPPDLSLLWREVGALAGVVEAAMSKERANRFNNAAEFAAALRTLSITTLPAPVEGGLLGLQDARAYNRRGLAYVSTRNYEQAIVAYSRALELDPHFAEAFNNRSAAHLLMGNYGQAVADCTQAIALAPDFVAATVNRGIAHTGLRQYDQALADYNHALTLTPQNVYAFYNRGNTFLWMSQFKEAVANYSQAIALSRDFGPAYVNRGVAHTELKQYDLALADFNQAIDDNPAYVYAYYNRATLYKELGENEPALADYSQVIELNPEHRYAYENRGDVLAALGQDDLASEDYTRIIVQTASIHPKRLSVASSMMMPATPLDFLTRQ
jgi:serine/threonine protein kinase